MAGYGSQCQQSATIKIKPMTGIAMDSSNNLSNISLSTPSLEEFKGIENGKITAVFNSDAKLTKPTVFGRTITDKVTGAFSKSAHQKLEKKHASQKDLAERRATILAGTDNSTGEIEDKLLELIGKHTSDQKNQEKQFVKANSLSKQIQEDIRIHLSNEIRKATTPDGLQELHNKIQRLESAPETDESLRPKVDKKILKDLQKEIDKQCDRVARQLAEHLEKAEMGKVNPDVAVDMKCRCLIKWSDTIKKISPDSFKSHQKPLDQLLSKTLVSGLSLVKPHPDNLEETQKTLSIIEKLSDEVNQKIKGSLGKKSKHYKKACETTEPCLTNLRDDLKNIPELVSSYSRELKNITNLERREKEQLKEKKKIKQTQNTEETKRADLKTQKITGFWGKHKVFRLLDRDYQKQVGSYKKTTNKLSKKMGQANKELDNLKSQLQQARSTRDQLSENIEQAIAKYGQSIKKLDEFSSLNNTNNATISVESLRLIIEDTATTATTKPPLPKKGTKIPVPPPLH